MTLAELEKARWIPITSGISYINLEKDQGITDSIFQFELIALTDSNGLLIKKIDTLKVDSNYFNFLIKGKLINSRHGYLKFNEYEFAFSWEKPQIHILLNDEYDSTNFKKDTERIHKTLPGVLLVSFTSKQKALQMYREDQQSSDSLEGNPFHPDISISLDPTVFMPKDFNSIENRIKRIIPLVKEVSIASGLRRFSFVRYFILEYVRKQSL
jgi:hypothetical protein